MPLSSLAALDVGGGTQDFLIWRAGQSIENAFKMVAPSPTRVAAARIAKATQQGRSIYLTGHLMGGGALMGAVKQHLAAGLEVYAAPKPALSLSDDLDQVSELGVIISPDSPQGAAAIPTTDLDLEALKSTLKGFEADWPQGLAVAVCDHGFSPHYSNRKFRFKMWEDFLAGGGVMTNLITAEPPKHMTRMRAAVDQAPGALVMDTAAAALWGALEDPTAAARAEEGVCIINLGNMHTVGFLARQGEVLAIYEHHTKCLTPEALQDQISRFISGSISNEEVFDDNGHGYARLPDAPKEVSGPVIITGPQRRLAEGLGYQTANPFGDVMLSGCFGLVAAAKAFGALGE